MQRRTRRLVLDGDARPGSSDRMQLLGHAIAQLARLGGERAGEAHVELGAVAADEMDLLR